MDTVFTIFICILSYICIGYMTASFIDMKNPSDIIAALWPLLILMVIIYAIVSVLIKIFTTIYRLIVSKKSRDDLFDEIFNTFK